ncbi:MAG: hypothetical protein COA78_31005 [Blastopirellula sp.]|nr:MAG: hypothetical protein COA78_31005 [Blastopirellula sp.]
MNVSDQILDLLIECERRLRSGRPISIRDLADGDQELEKELQDHIQKLTSTYWVLNEDHSIPIGLDIPSESLLKQWQKLPAGLTHHKLLGHLTDSGLVDSTALDLLIEQRQISNIYQLVDGLTDSQLLSTYQLRYIAAGKAKNLILGKYLILDKIGEGGMGSVYKARHTRLDRLVALKVVSRDPKNKVANARFFREVQTVAKLSHPNIVAVHDSDESNNCQFMVMEYIEGLDLKEKVKRTGPLAVSQAVNYLIQAARGLDYSHSQGIIHRDIKPANLLVDGNESIKILDLGLVRIEDPSSDQAELTQHGVIMGTIDYMSPEQSFDAKTVDRRADIYSLGCTLHYLLTGKPPYTGSTQFARLLGHKEGTLPDLTQVRKDVPPQLNFVFQKLVSKSPADRYQTAAELIVDLENLLPAIATLENSVGTDIPIAPSSSVESDSSLGNASQFSPSFSQAPTQAPYQSPPASSRPRSAASRKVKGKRSRKGLSKKAIMLRGGILLAMLLSHFLLFDYIAGLLVEEEIQLGTLTVEVASDEFESQLVGKQVKIRNVVTNEEFLVTLSERETKRPMKEGSYELVFDADSKFLVPKKQFTIKPGVDLKLSIDWQPNKNASASPSQVADVQKPTVPMNSTSSTPTTPAPDVSERFGQSSLTAFGPTFREMAFYPTVTADDSFLIFLSSSVGSPTQIDTIYSSKFENSQWQTPRKISLGAEAGFPIELSADGLSTIVTRMTAEARPQFVQATRNSTKFSWPSKTFLRNKPTLINGSFEPRDPHLSEDGLTLIFSAAGPGSHGKFDLWICQRFSLTGSWGNPVNMGTEINSEYAEFSPTVSPNGLILCFGRRDLGDRDPLASELWISTRDSVRSDWKTPHRHVIGGRDSQLGGFEFVDGGTSLAFHGKPKSSSPFQLIKTRLAPTSSAGAKLLATNRIATPVPRRSPVLVPRTASEPSWGRTTGSGTEVVETRQFPELNSISKGDYSPSFSPDGLSLCWTRIGTAIADSEIRGANRATISSSFGTSETIKDDLRYGTFTPDRLDLVAILQEESGKTQFVSSDRPSVTFPLSDYAPISRFSRVVRPNYPVFNSTGTTLVFQRGITGDASRTEFAFSMRENREDVLGAPQKLPMQESPLLQNQTLSWPSLAEDDLTLWFCVGEGANSRIVRATRDSISDPFGGYQFLKKNGEYVRGCSPRFVQTSGELFYAVPTKEAGQGLWELVASKLEESTDPVPTSSDIASTDIASSNTAPSDPAMADDTGNASVPAVEEAAPTEILPLINLEKHTLYGTWSQDSNVLQSNFDGINAIEMPFDHDSSYALEIDCQLKDPSVGIATRLLTEGDRVFSIFLTNQYCNVETQRNNQILSMSRKNLPELADIFSRNSTHKIRYEVNTRNVKVVIDDQIVLDWNGDFKSLGKASDSWMMGAQKIALKNPEKPAISFSTAGNKMTRMALIDLQQAEATLATRKPTPKKPTPSKSVTPPLLTQNTIDMKLKFIPAGKAMLGQISSKVEITLTRPFYMGIHEVTQGEYFDVMGDNPSRNLGKSNPVDSVSWEKAMEFCQRLSSHPKEVAAGRVYRLPTEAEWEYACRAGTSTRYSFGDDPNQMDKYAWYSTNSVGTSHPVGTKLPNPWGLHDMHGNVREWCVNYWYARQPETDPQGMSLGTSRGYRGGSYSNTSSYDSGYRSTGSATSAYSFLGFRVVMFQRKK